MLRCCAVVVGGDADVSSCEHVYVCVEDVSAALLLLLWTKWKKKYAWPGGRKIRPARSS